MAIRVDRKLRNAQTHTLLRVIHDVCLHDFDWELRP